MRIGNVDLIVARISLIERIERSIRAGRPQSWKNGGQEESLTNKPSAAGLGKIPPMQAAHDGAQERAEEPPRREKEKERRRVLIDDVRRMRRLSTSARAPGCCN